MPVAPAMLGTHQAFLGIGQAKQMNLLPPKLIPDAFKAHRRARASVRGFALHDAGNQFQVSTRGNMGPRSGADGIQLVNSNGVFVANSDRQVCRQAI